MAFANQEAYEFKFARFLESFVKIASEHIRHHELKTEPSMDSEETEAGKLCQIITYTTDI